MPHPLSPLQPPEISLATGIATAGAPGARVVSAALHEPAKAAYLAWREGDASAPAREALVVLAHEGRVVEVVVDLDEGAERARRVVDGAHPPITPEDYDAAGACVLADERMRAALRERGVDDPDLVQIDVLPSGAFDHHLEPTHRFARAVAYLRHDPHDNAYARPIEHLVAYVDLDALEVLYLDEGERRPIPPADGDFRAGVVAARDDLRPFSLTQPDGVSFTVEGGEVRWHRWSLVPAIDPQEGLVIHDVRYDGRPVLHRASCAEMIVPYGEPDPMHAWRTYFDAGEYGLGACMNSLELGCDCLGEIVYLDAHLADHAGSPRRIANAICLHEEDAGILWKHTDHAGGVEVRRGRRLVVNAMATVGNYEYAFRWYLSLDGSIEMEIQLHGIVSTMALSNGAAPLGSNVVDRGLAAPHHQHLFCFRLDLDVDGRDNHVHEVESERVATGDDNPLGNAFRPRVTALRSEGDARREASEATARVWTASSAQRRNVHGQPTAYRLVPGHGTATLLAQPGSSVDRRAGFARHTLWVTPYEAAERHPAGAYPYQHADPGGLPAWSADRDLDGRDVVFWYTVGVTHFVRPEDWPIMPMTKAGFSLQPVGFHDRNPTLDIPAPAHHCAGAHATT